MRRPSTQELEPTQPFGGHRLAVKNRFRAWLVAFAMLCEPLSSRFKKAITVEVA